MREYMNKKEEEKTGVKMTDEEIYQALKEKNLLEPPIFEEGFDEKVLVKFCQDVLHALNLGDYSVRTTPSYGIWGDCSWAKRKIRLSELLFLNSKIMKNHKEAYDTIIHEVCHACRPLCAHGKKWKSLMEKLGCYPKRSKQAHLSVRSRIPYKFVLIDKDSNKVIKGWTRNCKKVKDFMAQNESSPKYLCMAHDGSPVDLA